MLNNSTKMMFMVTLISGIVITISSNSWLGAWMGLEINLLSFIPIMSSDENIYNSEASLKYFLIQTLASSSLLFLILSSLMMESMFTFSMLFNNMDSIISSPLLLKSGSAPFHWWFPSVMEGLEWMNCFILMSLQKIAPLILLSYIVKMSLFLVVIIFLCISVGAVGGLNQVSIRKILTYSSINHIGWMMSGMFMSEVMWLSYFLIYSLLILSIIFIVKPFQISFINQTFLLNNDTPIMKFIMFMNLLSLGGLPPFLGFMPKWMIINFMLFNSMISLLTTMIIFSLLTLFYYLRMSYSSFILNHSEPNWNLIKIKEKFLIKMMISSSASLLGLLMLSLLSYFV